MNSTIRELYQNLMALCSPEDSAFYYKDHDMDGKTYRIFTYRIASYTDFLKPGALECRGTMFEVDRFGMPLRVAARTPTKFFNLNENPFTASLDHNTAVEFMDKADGSLISTFMHNGQLKLKTKASLTAEQIQLAWDFLNKPEQVSFLQELTDLTRNEYTINMEIVSPLNRVVLPYGRTELKVLNLRNIIVGETLYKDNSTGILRKYWVDVEDIDKGDQAKFIESIALMEDIEGFVVRYADGQLVKIKTDWYKTLHHTKDSITIPRRLFECVVTETTDDLRSLFHDDAIALQAIMDMENLVVPKLNSMIHTVEAFYAEHKNLSRKDYAILGTKLLGELFSLGMTLYLHERGLKSDGPDYKAFAIKNYKSFGITDVETGDND